MATRLRGVRPFAIFSCLFLNPHAYRTTTNSLTPPMPVHPSTYFFTHTCMGLLIHCTSYHFIYHLRAALLSSHFELTLRSHMDFFSDLVAYNFFSLFVQLLACLPSCLRPPGLGLTQ